MLPLVPAGGGVRIDRGWRVGRPKCRAGHRAAFAVGCRVQQIAVGHEVAVGIDPGSRGARGEMPDSRRAVAQPLVDGVGRRDVLAHEELHGRLPVAEHIVGRAEPRLQILLIEGAVLGGEHDGGRQEPVRSHPLLVEVVGEALEAEAALQREAAQRPFVLRIQREHALMLLLARCLIGVHGQLVGNAALEVVLEQGVVVEVFRKCRVVGVIADAELRRVRAGDADADPWRMFVKPV